VREEQKITEGLKRCKLPLPLSSRRSSSVAGELAHPLALKWVSRNDAFSWSLRTAATNETWHQQHACPRPQREMNHTRNDGVRIAAQQAMQ